MNTKAITVTRGLAIVVILGIPRDQEKAARRMFNTTLERLENIMTVSSKKVQAEIKKSVPMAGTPSGALKAYRLRQGLTQARLSALSGINQGHISEMEKGKRTIGLRSAKTLAKVLHCRWDRLVN